MKNPYPVSQRKHLKTTSKFEIPLAHIDESVHCFNSATDALPLPSCSPPSKPSFATSRHASSCNLIQYRVDAVVNSGMQS